MFNRTYTYNDTLKNNLIGDIHMQWLPVHMTHTLWIATRINWKKIFLLVHVSAGILCCGMPIGSENTLHVLHFGHVVTGDQTPVVRLGGGKYVHPQSHPTDQIEKVFLITSQL